MIVDLSAFVVDRLTGERFVLRDDLCPGGTKRRALEPLLEAGREYVYAGPGEGYAQVALAYAAGFKGARACSFVAARKHPHENTKLAQRAGAYLERVRPGYLSCVKARAKEYCEERGAVLLPFGLDAPEFRQALFSALEPARRIVEITAGRQPPEVWVAAGSGVLTRTLQRVWPEARHVAVQVGRTLSPEEAGSAKVIVAPEQFAAPAKQPPSFPSCSNYDAKVWQFFKDEAASGALFWNVAG